MDRKQIMKYAFAAGVVLGVTAAVLILARGSGQEKKVEAMGPEEVAVCFCRAMAAGDFTGAYALCDTSAMKTYIEDYVEAWEMQNRKDSSAVRIAGQILSNAEIVTESVEKKDGKRIVTYTIEVSEGLKKTRTATVKKMEDGEWKVEEITDRN